MKFRCSYLVLLLLIALLVITPDYHVTRSLSISADNVKSTTVLVRLELNGRPVFTDVPARIQAERTLVPLRPLAELMGFKIDFNNQTSAIEIHANNRNIKLFLNDKNIIVNSFQISLPEPPELINDMVMVPLTFFEDQFDLNSTWDPTTRTVSLCTRDYIVPDVSGNTAENGSIPILMYHEIGDGVEYGVTPNSLYVRASEFNQQMHYLQQHDYHVVTLADAVRLVKSGEPTDKTVVVTFDDGYVSFYTKAFPILKECRFPATVFIITGMTTNFRYLSWDEIKNLSANWMEIGSHTQHHWPLPSLDESGLENEIVWSKKIIEEELGVPVESFSYPAGAYRPDMFPIINKAGYIDAVTTKPGMASSSQDLLQLPRIRVYRGMTINKFAQTL